MALGSPRPQHLSAPAQPECPVGEAAGRVERADNQARANHQCSLAKRVDDHILAQRLERAVVRLDVLAGRVVHPVQRSVLGAVLAAERVD